MKKRGQFYIIAAIIIVVVIVGLSSIANYAIVRKKPVKFYDLGEELNIESGRVVEHGIYNEIDVPSLIEDFTDKYFVNYSEEKEKGTELIFVYGNKENAKISTYTTEATGEIILTYGAGSFTISGYDKYIPERKTLSNIGEDSIVLNIFNNDYSFSLQEGENFLFVISKKTEEETYITSS